MLREANPQEIKSSLLPQGASPAIIAARVLKCGPFRAARTGGALGAYCDRGSKRAHLGNIKKAGCVLLGA